MAAALVQAQTGIFGGFKLIVIQQDGWQEGPIPANPGFHRMNAAPALVVKDAAPNGFVFYRQTQRTYLQIVLFELLHGHFQILGHQVNFTWSGKNAAPAFTTLAALLALEHRLACF